MIIELNKNSLDYQSANTGSILIFSNGIEYDYYMITETYTECKHVWGILQLSTSKILDTWCLFSDMMDSLLSDIKNDFRLVEIIDSKDVKLGRVNNA